MGLISYAFFAKIFGCCMLATLIWEHFGRRYNSRIRPSVMLTFLSEKFQKFFRIVGEYAAWISSYLTQIDLKDLFRTIGDIVNPAFGLIVSPLYFIYGYVMTAKTYLNKTWLIYAGSVILVAVFMAGYHKLTFYYPSLNFYGALLDNILKFK
ncbi:MAG: putative ORFan [Satyrvirus sp.]|uniref:Putative ORFan n=1 Tax=Satyrvirus sp. TaxID=2487771 RepID=A0A3G5ACW7_9VIRU|nr:MAG: putative ORFan [Satyrvirus sp.]